MQGGTYAALFWRPNRGRRPETWATRGASGRGSRAMELMKVKGPEVNPNSPQVRDIVQVTCLKGSRENVEPVKL
jgi:hypothetical protein